MNANDIEQNCSETTKSNTDKNANTNNSNQDLASNNRGAIPKRRNNLADKVNCFKINNNTNLDRNCCKMGLGNGNDTNLDILTKASKDINPFKQISTDSVVDTNYVKQYSRKCSPINSNSFNSVDKSCDKCSTNNKLDTSESDTPLMMDVANSLNDVLMSDDTPGPSCSLPLSQDTSQKSSDSSSSISQVSDITDSESEDISLSLSDDGCVYTYKGGNIDFSERFFMDNRQNDDYVLQPRIEIPVQPQRRESSPEMDYLEMDFDPGPSCEADSESSVDIDLDDQNIKSDVYQPLTQPLPDVPKVDLDLHLPSTSTGIRHENNSLTLNYYNLTNISNERTNSDEQTPEDDSECSLVADQSLNNDCLESNLAQTIFYPDRNRPTSPFMFWDEKYAQQKQFNLLHAGCVTNAVLNALLALNKIPQKIIPKWANKYLQINPRDTNTEDVNLVEYLLLKSKSLPSHEDLISGLRIVSDDNVYTRFFPTWPERDFSLSHWLKYWLDHKIIPIITINQQVNAKDFIVPEWQHHMVFGVNTNGIYLADPIECISEEILLKKLTSDSILLIKCTDILSRWKKEVSGKGVDLGPLYSIDDRCWHRVNTLGKLVHFLREVKNGINTKSSFNPNAHLPIPTSVRAGITLVSSLDNPACDLLEYCPELPLKK